MIEGDKIVEIIMEERVRCKGVWGQRPLIKCTRRNLARVTIPPIPLLRCWGR